MYTYCCMKIKACLYPEFRDKTKMITCFNTVTVIELCDDSVALPD